MTTTLLVQMGAQDAPVACTLDADQHDSRAAELSELAGRALTRRSPIAGGRRLTFIDTPDVERELRVAVAAESSCCSFLTMRLTRADGALVLDVTGPAHAAPIIAELFA
jgi:hypothetical protein